MRVSKSVMGLVLAAASVSPVHSADIYRRQIHVRTSDGSELVVRLPAGMRTEFVAKAMDPNTDGTRLRLSGHVAISAVDGVHAVMTLQGEDVVLIKQPIPPDEAQAITDLENMRSSDQRIRGAGTGLTAEEGRQQAELDDVNMRRLQEIIAKYGWPGYEFAGVPGAKAAFLVVQHTGDLSLQDKYLPMLRSAVARNDASAADLALLEDRVRVRHGQLQIYGSQLSGVTPLTPEPIEDPEHVDERRRAVGLPPLAEYLASFKAGG